MCKQFLELLVNKRGREKEDAAKQILRAKECNEVMEIKVWLHYFEVFAKMMTKFVLKVDPGIITYMVSIIRAIQKIKQTP